MNVVNSFLNKQYCLNFFVMCNVCNIVCIDYNIVYQKTMLFILFTLLLVSVFWYNMVSFCSYIISICYHVSYCFSLFSLFFVLCSLSLNNISIIQTIKCIMEVGSQHFPKTIHFLSQWAGIASGFVLQWAGIALLF